MTLYEILNMKGNSIFKSMTVSKWSDSRYSNVRIEAEPYDQTMVNVQENSSKGSTYIVQQLEKKMMKESVREKIMNDLELDSFIGALVTIYSNYERPFEYYIQSDGVNQYDMFDNRPGSKKSKTA